MLKRLFAGAAMVVVAAAPAFAIDPGANFTVNRIRAATPQCGPGAGPYVGRVTGVVGFGREGGRMAGFVGCFDDPATCNYWRIRVLGAIDGRIVYNRCEVS